MNRDQWVAGGVAGAAFACSAQHIYEVALAAGNPPIIAGVHPLGIDGLIYIGMRAVSGGRKWQGWLATVYGVAASLTFNAVSYRHVQMPAWVMAVAMPLALVLGVLVVGHGPASPVVQDTARRTAAKVRDTAPVTRPTPVPDAVPALTTAGNVVKFPKQDTDSDARRDKALGMLADGRTKADVAATVGVSTRTLNRWIKPSKSANGGLSALTG